MKRPLAVSGLVYLTVLTVVFYFRTPAVMLAVTAAATVMVCSVLVLRHFKPLPVAALVTGGISAMLAVLSIFLFQNLKVQPLVDQYTGRAVRVEGYLGDLVTEGKYGTVYLIHTETIDGAPCSTKISYTVYSKKDWEPFDKLCVTLTPKPSTYSYSLSSGIFLRAAETKKSNLVLTGEKHQSPYAMAVALRLEMQKILDNYLDDNAQSLASAVLLGEKNALEPDVRDAFSDTGMSYLVVVSGMHLAIITMLLKKLLKPRFGAKGMLRMVLITVFLLLYAAVTGFTPSVVRAAVMMLFIVTAPLFRRESDSINALGAAALVLTLPNPFVVGNVGLLLSFAATLGILLWADTILRFCILTLHLSPQPRREKTRISMAVDLCKRAAALPISLFAVSLAATLWTIPLAMVFFGRITPATVLISFVAYPLTFLLLLLSLLLVLTAWSPLVHALAPLINGIAQLLTDTIRFSTKLPFTSVKTDSAFWYVWMVVTVLLIAIGVLIRAKRNYIIFAVAVSALTLSIGGSLTVLLCWA